MIIPLKFADLINIRCQSIRNSRCRLIAICIGVESLNASNDSILEPIDCRVRSRCILAQCFFDSIPTLKLVLSVKELSAVREIAKFPKSFLGQAAKRQFCSDLGQNGIRQIAPSNGYGFVA